MQQVGNTDCTCNRLARKMCNIKITRNVFKGSLQYADKAAQLAVRKALTPMVLLWFSAFVTLNFVVLHSHIISSQLWSLRKCIHT